MFLLFHSGHPYSQCRFRRTQERSRYPKWEQPHPSRGLYSGRGVLGRRPGVRIILGDFERGWKPKLSDSGKYNHLTRMTVDLWLGIYSSTPVICLMCVLFSSKLLGNDAIDQLYFCCCNYRCFIVPPVGSSRVRRNSKCADSKLNMNHSSAQKSLKHPGKKRLTSQPLCKKGTFGGIFPLWP